MRIVIIGRPASGKSTLTDLLTARDPNLATFGVRRHFSAQVEAGTAVGNAVRAIVERNDWIPDELVVGAVRSLLESGELGSGFILEGMPGNREQARLLDALLAEHGLPLDCAVHVATPEPVCVARAARRTVCYRCDGGSHQAVRAANPDRCARCGGPVTPRDADATEPFTRRLALYRVQSREILGYYGATRVLTVDGQLPAPEIAAAVIGRVTACTQVAVDR
jgi:adenylate kinase